MKFVFDEYSFCEDCDFVSVCGRIDCVEQVNDMP